jgi:predicted deacylase
MILPAGVTSRVAAEPGPHVAVTGLVHGDEPCGRVAVERLRSLPIAPRRGRLSLALVNLAAAEACHRHLGRDMNRLWRDDWLESAGSGPELERARELRPWLRTVDFLLDLHSTAFVPRPFFVLADLPKARALADAMGDPDAQQLMPGGCAEGRHLTDYGRFADPADPAVAVTVECGRHDDPMAGEVAFRAALRFLAVTGAIAAKADPPMRPIERWRTGPPCIARTDRFCLRVPLTGFVAVKAGEVVALDGEEPVQAPFDALVLSPRPAPAPGEVAFFWCQPADGLGEAA